MTVHDILESTGKLWAVLEKGMAPRFHDSEEKALAAAKGLKDAKVEEGVSFRLNLTGIGFNMPKEIADDKFKLAGVVTQELKNIVVQIMTDAMQDAPQIQVAGPGDIPPEPTGDGPKLSIVRG